MKNETLITLCGSNYGETYIPATCNIENCKVVNLFTRGSQKSQQVSKKFSIPLYKNFEEAISESNLAILATNDDVNTKLSKALFDSKVPFILEHPIKTHNLESIISLSNKHKIPFLLNTHFTSTVPIKKFIASFENISKYSEVQLIEVSANSRTLFSTLDIIEKLVGLDDISVISSTNLGDNHLNHVLNISGKNVVLNLQTWENELDDSSDCIVGHSIRVNFNTGNLLLANSFGPIVWSPIYSTNYPTDYTIHELFEDKNKKLDVANYRINANKDIITQLIESNFEECKAYYERYLRVSKAWETLLPTHTKTLQSKEIDHRIWKISK
ncbi:hypothetical protein JL49_24170 [Pseudoalteromonas luteoviolacea]|nr:hypothetical protein JL49_24170 [Pseudoalteromonas luteoviolacea]